MKETIIKQEKRLLAKLLTDSRLLGQISFLKPKHFSGAHNGLVYKSMLDLGKYDNFIPVSNYANDKYDIDRSYISELLELNGDLDVKHFATMIYSFYYDERVHKAGSTEDVEKLLKEKGSIGGSDISFVKWDKILVDSVKEIGQEKDVVKYGYSFLDDQLGGIFKGEVLVLGGITGTGKTTLSLNVAHKLANDGKKVCVAALEDRLVMRGQKALLYQINRARGKMREKKIRMVDFLTGKEKATELEIDDARKAILSSTDYVSAKTHMSVYDLENIYSRGYDLVVLDHLHYFGNMNAGDMSKANKVEETMQFIKYLTVKYNTRTILVAHFKKIDESKRPTMTDFKDSISIPQTADTVMMLWRDKSSAEDSSLQYETEFICPKSRIDCPSFTAEATFDIGLNDYVDIKQSVSYGTYNSEKKENPNIINDAMSVFNQ